MRRKATDGLPMTKEEADNVWSATKEIMDQQGFWMVYCPCGENVGGSTRKEYKPHEGMCCPACGKVNTDLSFKAEWIDPEPK